jgi:glycosyltransferase involved in cell wall biosynthesis
VVFTEHGIEYPYRKKWKRCLVNPILLRMADSVTTIAHYTRRNLERYENYPKGGVRVLYNGIDVAAYSQGESPQAARSFLGIPAEKKTVGVVARLDPVKNHPLLFRSLREVIQFFPETELLIVGDGPNRAELELLANRLGLDSHIRFLGARRDVPHIIRAMDIFVLPSLSEGMSITLLEAMGAGLPVVATRVGGNPEVVVDGETGFLVPSDDERRMAARLKTLLGDSRLRQKMGAAGKLRAESVFSMEKTVSEYHRLYEKVLKNERV